MKNYKTAFAAEVARLVALGWNEKTALKRARKTCRPLHPSHKRAVARRTEAANTANESSNTFHSM